MIRFIKHRVNEISEISKLESSWGAEIDLRSSVAKPGSIHLAHDPWIEGDSLEDWILEFKDKEISGPLILNTKEDGLEERALEILGKFSLANEFFFLDTTIPSLVKWTREKSFRNFALRYSAYETTGFEKGAKLDVEWAWIDCFDGIPLSKDRLQELVGKYKLCLVSPELQGRPIETAKNFLDIAKLCTAICTKDPQHWQNLGLK
jgi:hypothetical protein